MDNFGDWLYYIIFLVVAIVSFVNSAKKKNRSETAVPPPPPPAYEQALPVPVLPGTKRKTPPPAPEQAKKRTGGYVPLFQNEGQRVLENEMPFPAEDTSEIPLADRLELNSADAFRKALIYSEILNRKY
jgi:hypothetical protein